ncbi:histidinol dehydrogenase [Candidatus Nitrosacidococcus tergens]|uniref:Histidinol dehydrogenase n=1 Tax=Candidatus Nitrosacidococcus tergens TaxID=553981 RepID=A0A7G1QB92_9GAMM|nr:histidinol dehydrogenase [Candidatus Nitrosacidococcus tergens]CAB1277233.1 Histidinol dehydrogenase [Candidatus Nitrosacidococcus tergens]
MANISRLKIDQADFWKVLEQKLAWNSVADENIVSIVQDIVREVRSKKDKALLEYTYKFDHVTASSVADLEVPMDTIEASLSALPIDQQEALKTAAQRITHYHQHQRQESWIYTEADGTVLGQQITPLDRVGLYVPGGKAAYPSSVLMNALPAKVAGVPELIMVVPSPHGEINRLVLAAAAVAGVDRVFTVGGAQAIAALAFGTETIPKVDKIVGPGNIYVATAKSIVFGQVGIDMIAGPSEILVFCDGKTDSEWITTDLFSQAEHDEDAQAILLSTDKNFLDQIERTIEKLLPTFERHKIIETSLKNRGMLIEVENVDQALEIINFIAPEHLELSVENPQDIASHVRHAGAIFMGRYTAEALGDYCAGPNHVLPTSRTARFASPLGVYDFQKRSSLIQCSPKGSQNLGKIASILARGEGLTAHARSAEHRF